LASDDLASGLLLRPLGQLFVRLESAYWIALPRHVFRRPETEVVVEWLKRQAAGQPGPG
jgi:DNA-binding transcriptional LysR family regulator